MSAADGPLQIDAVAPRTRRVISAATAHLARLLGLVGIGNRGMDCREVVDVERARP
jgi:hypothetical protein